MRVRTFIWATSLLLTLFSGVIAYASLGEGRRKAGKRHAQIRLSNRIENTPGTFSLKSGYQFRGNLVLTESSKTSIRVNSVVSLQKGNQVYTMPLKKEVWIQKLKLTLGNQSLRPQ